MTDLKHPQHEEGILKDEQHVEGIGVNQQRKTDNQRPIQDVDMRHSPMMARLWDDLKNSVNIGHYGRLVFTMVARHYLDEGLLIKLLSSNLSPVDAQAMLLNVNARNYNPPRRNVILRWQAQQEYKIIPPEHVHDLRWGNVYSELRLPLEIYGQVGEFYKEAAKDFEEKK